MFSFKKVPAVLTVVTLIAACTGCGSNTTTAMTIDDYVVPAGVYLYYLNSSYSNAVSQLSQENEDLDKEDTKTIQTLYLEDKDVRTWVEDKATELCVDFVATEKKFDELGLTLDAETEEQLESMLQYYWGNYSNAMIELGVSEESFRKVMTSSYKSEAVFDYYYDIDAEEGVTEEELQDYYAENNIRAQYVKFDLHDSEGNVLEDAKKSEILELAKKYQNQAEKAYQDGGAEAVMTEMNIIQDDYNYYMTSVSEQEAGIAEESLTTTTARTETKTVTTETSESTAVDVIDDALLDLGEEPTQSETETTVSTEETPSGTDDSIEPDTDSETETETETVSYANESVISIINPEDYEDAEEIYYTPSEDVYNQLLSITDADYGKVYLVEEEEAYYLVTRYAIRDRITEEDLWNENTIYNARISKYSDAFEEKMEEWSAILNITKNDASFKRYDPFKFHVV
ncbi:MAG: hypothetical protein K2H89_03575 [Oscillospiraceae bacterium]|nr:hypothetical protein [Oscillospiraceae bacterium]